jgi:omega-amidase
MRRFFDSVASNYPSFIYSIPVKRSFSYISMSSHSTVKFAGLQILCTPDKAENLRTAHRYINEAASAGAKIISLPEIFNSPYATDQFAAYAEPIPSKKADIDASIHTSVAVLSKAASENGVFLIGGSIPEIDDGKIYNTCIAFNPEGEIVAKHRKIHLFDIDIPGKMTFKESDTLTGGSNLATFDTPYGKVGLGICYDIRFPYLTMLLRQAGCRIIVFPGAFNTVTGPLHWELLAKARALDSQCYVAVVSPARNPDSKYQAWGHTSVIGPFADVLATTDEKPSTVYADLDLHRIDEVRAQIPVGFQVRNDLYELKWKEQN